ncbi:hypothetical protein [Mycobacteroides chelonae]|jgi:DNA gyrase inhibitor GyrI|uniref:hypothetical protein n=1 Tax=Mycobacteroides chelonae TaxID=1774 RepID=UPI0009927A1A|nr:hypothetical protein [Mycobacteroides chelonae]
MSNGEVEMVPGKRVKMTWTLWTDEDGVDHRNVMREGVIRPLPEGKPEDMYRGYLLVALDGIGERLIPRRYVERGRIPDGRCRAHRVSKAHEA